MTMVAKNSGGGRPEPNAGATLFVQSTEARGKPGGVPVAMVTQAPANPGETEADCRARMLGVTADARSSREKRLMAHLGLKGYLFTIKFFFSFSFLFSHDFMSIQDMVELSLLSYLQLHYFAMMCWIITILKHGLYEVIMVECIVIFQQNMYF